MSISFAPVKIENAHIVSLFLFQYSLTMLLTRFFSPTIIVMGSSLILVGLSIAINGFKFKYPKCIICFYVVAFLLGVKLLQNNENGLYPLLVYIEITGPVLVVMANGFDYRNFIHFSYKLAYINFFSIALYPFLESFAYMRFGYGMLLTVVFMYIKIFGLNDKSNIADIILLIGSFIMMFIFGSRGATFSFLVLVVIDRVIIKKSEIVNNMVVALSSLEILFNFEEILSIFQTFGAWIGVRTYSLSKLIMQLNSGVEAASSGRGKIYRTAIERIDDNWVFGVPMEINENGGTYAHNLFIQAGLDFGIFGIAVMALVVIVMLYQIWRSSKRWEQCYVLAILFSIAIGRLMFSSIIWRRPEFWMLLIASLIMMDNKGMEHD